MDGAAAAACAGELEDPLAITFACCQLLGACSRVQDFERAGQWCDRIAVMCDRENIWTVLAVSRCMYAPVLVARGHYAEAESGSWRHRIRHYHELLPHHAGEAAVWLADLRVRQGRTLRRRVELLDRAEPDAGCRLVRATIALDARAPTKWQSSTPRRSAPVQREPVRGAAGGVRGTGASRTRLPSATGIDAPRARLEVERMATVLGLAVGAGDGAARTGRASKRRTGELDEARVALEDAADLFERRQIALRGRPHPAGSGPSAGRTGTGPARRCVERARGEQALADLRDPPARCRRHSQAVSCEVLALVAAGALERRDRRRLVVSTHTVHRHIANLMRKLGVGSRTAAVSRGIGARADLNWPDRAIGRAPTR